MQDSDSRTDALVYSVEEAGRLLGLSRATAYAMCKAGAIPTLRFGRAVRVPKVAMERMLEAAGQQDS
jgi:excisionase family DNA binding protein